MKKLELREEDGAVHANFNDLALYDNGEFNPRYLRFVKLAREANGKSPKLNFETKKYQEITKTTLGIYFRALLNVHVQNILIGNRILFSYHILSFHISDYRKDKLWIRKIKYKYIQAFRGIFPVLSVGVKPRILGMTAGRLKTEVEAVKLYAYFTNKMSRMISYQIINENTKYNQDWYKIFKKHKV